MENYYLAVDIGASSGRHILGWMEEGRLKIEEIYRFPNSLIKKNGHLCWNFDQLFREIVVGMKRCKALGKQPVSIGIDTWGVDFALLDKQNQVIGDVISYRDRRTEGMDEKLSQIIPEEELYGRNGIQKATFNSIYQLYAIKEEHPEYLSNAKAFLMTPEYFNFRLTGIKKAEYTIATTTQLINAKTNGWDYKLMERLGYPGDIFLPIGMPGSAIGMLRQEMVTEIGYDCNVMLVGSHDTASAVVSVPTQGEEVLYISSGTWSLMGTERREPDLSIASRKRNFTNEGGCDYRFRYLKNIMGLWMIQSVRRELQEKFSFGQLCACIYQSLAESYAETVHELEEITGLQYSEIYIVGGGSNADYLNRLTAKKTQKTIYAGPSEATAIGNIAVQMLGNGVFDNLTSIRRCIYDSFHVKRYDYS